METENTPTKREIIFQVEDMAEYRIVCRFGYDHYVDYAWWTHIQKKMYYKKWIFFGEQMWKWYEVSRCWWSKDFDTIDKLKEASFKFFDENVLLKPRLVKKAMEL